MLNLLPHQGVVAAIISALSLVITLGILTYTLRHEKKHQDSNTQDEH